MSRSAQLKPGVWDTQFALGKCLLAQGRQVEAAVAFRERVRLVAEDFPEMVMAFEEWLGLCR